MITHALRSRRGAGRTSRLRPSDLRAGVAGVGAGVPVLGGRRRDGIFIPALAFGSAVAPGAGEAAGVAAAIGAVVAADVGAFRGSWYSWRTVGDFGQDYVLDVDEVGIDGVSDSGTELDTGAVVVLSLKGWSVRSQLRLEEGRCRTDAWQVVAF